MSPEIWKPVPVFHNYEVSSLGRVRRRTASSRSPVGHIMTGVPAGNGYLGVCLSHEGTVKRHAVHRLVCTVFHGPCPDWASDATHINGRKPDNRAENLKWATSKQNQNDKRTHGTMAMGEKIAQAKLTVALVHAIRKEYELGKSQRFLAKKYNVCQPNISAITSRKTWRHI